MKIKSFILFAVATALIYWGCSQENPMSSQPMQDQTEKLLTKADIQHCRSTEEDEEDEIVADQSFTAPQSLDAAINEGFKFVAQTFTSGVTGRLVGVSLHITSFNKGSFPLRITIQTVTNTGVPSGRILSKARFGSSASLSQVIRFRKGVKLVAGRKYAIVVDYFGAPPPGPGQAQGTWTGATGDAYPKGEAYFSVNGSSWFLSGPDHDLHFITYMAPRNDD